MRYIASKQGLVLTPRSHFSHKELAGIAGLGPSELTSAGFLKARYAPEDLWTTFGRSIGLDLDSVPVVIPSKLWVGQIRCFLIFSDNPQLLAGCQNVTEAVWDMSDEGLDGTCSVYAPRHPHVRLTANEILRG